MGRAFFLETERVGFSHWTRADGGLALRLWGDPRVARYLHASGVFTPEEALARLGAEIALRESAGVQYFPIFDRIDGGFLGCCRLRPHGEGRYELGFHLMPERWGQGYAAEAARAMIGYAFSALQAEKLFAGHHPENAASQRLLEKLGFRRAGEEFYPPTGLYHPAYKFTAGEGASR